MISIGSREWCEFWAKFYLQQAEKFARLKYPQDEVQMWYSLLRWAEWKDQEPWV